MPKNHDIIEIAGEVRHETEKAYLFFNGSRAQWVSKCKTHWCPEKKVLQIRQGHAAQLRLITRICKVDGCNGKHLSNGFCNKHYQRVHKNGSLSVKVLRGAPAYQRVLLKTIIIPDTSCWLFQGAKNENGYGMIRDGIMRSAHIVMYEHYVGPVPDGLELDHLCRTRACVNPAHFEPVTHQENVRRGRAGHNGESLTRDESSGRFLPVDKGLI